MAFEYTEEREALRSTVRRFLEDRSPESEVRRLMDTHHGYDPAVWDQMARQLGLQSLAIPEAYGGSGFGYRELAVVLEEMGRALLCAPFFSSVVLAVGVLLSCDDDEAKAQYLPGIADGTTVATLAFAEHSGRWDCSGVSTVATMSDGQWKISGEKSFVLDGTIASLQLVVARTDHGISLFAVDPNAGGVQAAPLSTLDQTRKQARVSFQETPARLVGSEGRAWQVISKALDLAAVGLAAEQIGGAQRALDMAVAYAKTRVQFGRPIGSFQAVKHRCANLFVEVESARTAAYYAAEVADADAADLPIAASMAKAYCSEAFTHVAADTIQIHGGIGFTWDHPAHLYFKRAKSSELLFGDGTHHRAILADRLGI